MMRFFRWLLAVNALAGCVSLAQPSREPERERPLLLVEGRRWDAPLLNPRPPEYGIASAAGCVVQGEFHVAIERLAYDTATRRLHVDGRLLSSPERGALVGTLLTWNEAGRAVHTPANSTGDFSLSLDLESNPTLSIHRLGYRTLLLDLRTLSQRAVRAPDVHRP